MKFSIRVSPKLFEPARFLTPSNSMWVKILICASRSIARLRICHSACSNSESNYSSICASCAVNEFSNSHRCSSFSCICFVSFHIKNHHWIGNACQWNMLDTYRASSSAFATGAICSNCSSVSADKNGGTAPVSAMPARAVA